MRGTKHPATVNTSPSPATIAVNNVNVVTTESLNMLIITAMLWSTPDIAAIESDAIENVTKALNRPTARKGIPICNKSALT